MSMAEPLRAYLSSLLPLCQRLQVWQVEGRNEVAATVFEAPPSPSPSPSESGLTAADLVALLAQHRHELLRNLSAMIGGEPMASSLAIPVVIYSRDPSIVVTALSWPPSPPLAAHPSCPPMLSDAVLQSLGVDGGAHSPWWGWAVLGGGLLLVLIVCSCVLWSYRRHGRVRGCGGRVAPETKYSDGEQQERVSALVTLREREVFCRWQQWWADARRQARRRQYAIEMCERVAVVRWQQRSAEAQQEARWLARALRKRVRSLLLRWLMRSVEAQQQARWHARALRRHERVLLLRWLMRSVEAQQQARWHARALRRRERVLLQRWLARWADAQRQARWHARALRRRQRVLLQRWQMWCADTQRQTRCHAWAMEMHLRTLLVHWRQRWADAQQLRARALKAQLRGRFLIWKDHWQQGQTGGLNEYATESEALTALHDKIGPLVAQHCRYVSVEGTRLVAPMVLFEGSSLDKGIEERCVDPTVADCICRETAYVLKLCNDLLAEQGMSPLGLVAEGHTSGKADGHELSFQVSVLRAHLCCHGVLHYLRGMLCTERLQHSDAGALTMELFNTWNQPARSMVDVVGWGVRLDDLIQPRGLGSHHPLANYSDGANYEANRRVELRFITASEESYCKPFDSTPLDAMEALQWPRQRHEQAALIIQQHVQQALARRRGSSRSVPRPPSFSSPPADFASGAVAAAAALSEEVAPTAKEVQEEVAARDGSSPQRKLTATQPHRKPPALLNPRVATAASSSHGSLPQQHTRPRQLPSSASASTFQWMLFPPQQPRLGASIGISNIIEGPAPQHRRPPPIWSKAPPMRKASPARKASPMRTVSPMRSQTGAAPMREAPGLPQSLTRTASHSSISYEHLRF